MSERTFTLATLKQRISDVQLFTVKGLAAHGTKHEVHLTRDEWMDLRADPEFAQALDRTQRYVGGKLERLEFNGISIFIPTGD